MNNKLVINLMAKKLHAPQKNGSAHVGITTLTNLNSYASRQCRI